MSAIGTQRLFTQSLLPSPKASQRAREKKATSRPRGLSSITSTFNGVFWKELHSVFHVLSELFVARKRFKIKVKKKERERERGSERHLRVLPSRHFARKTAPRSQSVLVFTFVACRPTLSSVNHDIGASRWHEDSMVIKDTYLRKRAWHCYGSMIMHPYMFTCNHMILSSLKKSVFLSLIW